MFPSQEYENNIDKIVKILDVNRSGTIDLAEFETLYLDAAQLFLNRFDFDQSGDLSIQELKALLNSNKLAYETLKKLKGMVRPLYNYGGGFFPPLNLLFFSYRPILFPHIFFMNFSQWKKLSRDLFCPKIFKNITI